MTVTVIPAVRRGVSNQWAEEEDLDLATDALRAMHETFVSQDIEIVIPPDFAAAVIMAVSDRRIRDSIVPGLIELIQSNVQALPGIDECVLARLDKLIVAGGRRRL